MEGHPLLERLKIQAKLLIPVVEALEEEIGRERAHAIVGRAIAESYAASLARKSEVRDAHPGEGPAPDFPIETETVEHSESSYGFDVHACAFADYFRGIGKPEIGALLCCGVDFAAEKVMRPGWEFRRSRTRMSGADTCDFRWRKRH